MAIPFQVVVVPLFVVMQRLNLINTFASVIVPGLAPAFGIFLMRQSIEEALPDELLDAARIDGATEFGIYSKIALPIMKPNLAALAIFFFMGSWNDFFWPLVVLRTQDMFTLPVALSAIIGVYERPYGPVMVGSFISIVPPLVIFLALQKYFMRGLVAGAFK
jgi:lactose/L-arabinose transport system permease protein